MNNYNKAYVSKDENKKEISKEESKNFKEKLKEKLSLVDQSENIKEQIKKQEEKIQELKNAVSIYFVNKCEFVNLREGQSKDSLVLAVLENGTLLEPIIYNDTTEWTKVKYKDKTGYIMTKYIGVEVSEPIE